MSTRGAPARGITGWMDRAFYPGYAHNWDNTRFRQYIEPHVTSRSRVLDYGAGRGALPQMNFRDAAAHVAGVDPDDAVLGNPYLHDARVLPLPSGVIPHPDASFDVVFATNVLEHVPDPALMLAEVGRVLVPGGVFLAKTPNSAHYVPLIARLAPHRFHEFINRVRGRPVEDTFPTVYACNSEGDVRRLARDAGFEVVDIQRWEGRPEYLRMNPLLYLAGLAYERLVNAVPALARFRCVLVFTLRKPA